MARMWLCKGGRSFVQVNGGVQVTDEVLYVFLGDTLAEEMIVVHLMD